MTLEQLANEQHTVMRREEYDDGWAVVVDLGVGTVGSVDVVDDTVIVVTEDDQYDVQLPMDADEVRTFIKNGVLTIEQEDSS